MDCQGLAELKMRLRVPSISSIKVEEERDVKPILHAPAPPQTFKRLGPNTIEVIDISSDDSQSDSGDFDAASSVSLLDFVSLTLFVPLRSSNHHLIIAFLILALLVQTVKGDPERGSVPIDTHPRQTSVILGSF